MSNPIIVALRPRKDGTQVRLVVEARDFYENVNGPAVFVRYEFFNPLMGEWRTKNEIALHAGDAAAVEDAINEAAANARGRGPSAVNELPDTVLDEIETARRKAFDTLGNEDES